MNSRDRYKEASTHALAGFQIIEESLKDYIGHYYDAVRKVLDAKLHFQYSRSDIDQAALGKLLSIFCKINKNEDLVKDLRKLIKHRDDLAHKALVHLYGEPKSDAEFDAMTDSAIEIAEKLGSLMATVRQEILHVYAIAREA
jgi:hypothetical protein